VFHRVERSAGDAIYTITKEAGVARPPRLPPLATLALQALAIDATAQTYLNATLTNPQHDIGCMTVVDYTFTWNRTKATADDGLHSPARNFEALIWVRAGAYARTYEVLINGVSAKITTPDGTTASDGNWVDTDTWPRRWSTRAGYTAIDGHQRRDGSWALASPGSRSLNTGSVIYIYQRHRLHRRGQGRPGRDRDGGRQGQGAEVLGPPRRKAPDGFTVRIVQQSGTNQDDFFVKFSKTAGDGTGVWEECLAPNASSGSTRTPCRWAWSTTVAGSSRCSTGSSGPPATRSWSRTPTSLGSRSRTTTFWQGRLGIVSGEGVTLSCADDPFQLYPRTLSTVLDSDPIGRVNPAPGETTFRYAIPFEGRLVLCGDNIQAQVTYDGVLTPLKATID
jgi:hypothetical protein